MAFRALRLSKTSKLFSVSQAERPVAFVDGQAVLERSHRLEFGVERVFDNSSNVEATAFFDTTSGRGVGLLSGPASAFSGKAGDAFIGRRESAGIFTRNPRGLHEAFESRLDRVGGLRFRTRTAIISSRFLDSRRNFESGMFQTGALQLSGGFRTGTQVRTVLALLSGGDRLCHRSFRGSTRRLRSVVEHSGHAGAAELWFASSGRSDSRRAKLAGRTNQF